jgi:hypothetical protein
VAQTQINMAHKDALTIYFEVEGTIRTSVDIADLCEFDADGVTVAVPYSLRIERRSAIATRVVENILYDHPHKEKIADILIKNDKFQVIRRDDNAEDDNCSRGTAFRRFLETTIGSNKTFRVAVRLYSSDMSMLKLNFRRNMAAPNALRYPASTVAAAAASLHLPPPAPNKVYVNPNMETKDSQRRIYQVYIAGQKSSDGTMSCTRGLSFVACTPSRGKHSRSPPTWATRGLWHSSHRRLWTSKALCPWRSMHYCQAKTYLRETAPLLFT